MSISKDITVVQKYSSISESFLYELYINNMMGVKHHYAFWMSIKNVLVKDLTFEEVMRLSKIEDVQNKAFKKPKWGCK
jgi:hypothetical protein